MAELTDREQERRRADQKFAAALHGMRLEGEHGPTGRNRSVRDDHLQRMKQRRGLH